MLSIKAILKSGSFQFLRKSSTSQLTESTESLVPYKLIIENVHQFEGMFCVTCYFSLIRSHPRMNLYYYSFAYHKKKKQIKLTQSAFKRTIARQNRCSKLLHNALFRRFGHVLTFPVILCFNYKIFSS